MSYTARTGNTIEEMKALMDDETWFTAAQTLEAGLVDQVDSPVKAAADQPASEGGGSAYYELIRGGGSEDGQPFFLRDLLEDLLHEIL